MFAIILIYMSLFCFVVIIALSLGYLVYIDWTNKRFHIRVNQIHSDFATVVLESLFTDPSKTLVNLSHIFYIKNKLKKKTYEKVFQDVIIEFANSGNNRILVSLYMEKYHDYLIRKIRRIKPNGSVNHIQNVFMLGEYRYDHPDIIAYLLEGVNSLSIISRFNSMSAISKIGNSEALVKSLTYISGHRHYMNMKVLTDILDNFEGSKDMLNQRLIESFFQFNVELKLLIINYFYNENNQEPIELFESYLKTVTNKEEHIQLLKYFGTIQYPKALPQIQIGLKSTYWEVRAIAAKSLSNYTEYFQLAHVIDTLADPNWYVRTNAASSILKHLQEDLHLSDYDVQEFMNSLTDKYAAGALEYARHLQEKNTSQEDKE